LTEKLLSATCLRRVRVSQKPEAPGHDESEVQVASSNKANPLDNKPLVVLSASIGQANAGQLISLSSNNRQVFAENSSHYIMIDRPDLVINAIREVFEAAQHHNQLKN
jgi:hypothetical protein